MSRFKIALGIVISVVLFSYLLWHLDGAALVEQLRHTSWRWVLVSAALALLGLWPRTIRWRYLFPPRSDPPGLLPAMLIGYMANNVLPLRAGEFVRVYVVARRWGHGFWLVLATLIVERVLDSIALVLILGVIVLMLPVPDQLRWAAIVLFVLDLAGMAMLTLLAVAPERCRRAVERLGHRWPHLEHRILRVFDTFVRGIEGVRTPSHLVPILVWSIIAWIIPALAAWTMLQAVGLPLPMLAGWTVLAFVGIGISLPSAPGYVGVFHAAAVLAVGLFGVSHSAGVGYAIIFHAVQFVPITVVGWIALLREHLSLGAAVHAQPPAEESALR
jgi:uncharacterized protein (TIRG00374 family)